MILLVGLLADHTWSTTRVRPLLVGELLVVLALVKVYDVVRSFAAARPDAALRHGADVLLLETHLHVDLERSVNHWLSTVTVLADLAAGWYQFVHLLVTLTVLACCYWRRPDIYRRARNSLVLVNLVGLAVFWLYPVAPPRLLPGAGFLDIDAIAGFGQGPKGPISPDMFGAMPSLHLAWATWTVIVARQLLREHEWPRRLVPGYAAVTGFVVVATANHYLMDVVAGIAVSLVCARVTGLINPKLTSGRTKQAVIAVFVPVVILLIVHAPQAAGISWSAVGSSILSVGPIWAVAMGVIWLAGLCAYATALAASLPGLTLRRALSLNLAGSAVANSVPLGGALSYALTTAMGRSWGFTPTSLTAFFAVTNVFNVLVRLLFGLTALIWFMVFGPHLANGASGLIVGAVAALAVLAASLVLGSDRLAAALGTVITRVQRRWQRLRGAPNAVRGDYPNLMIAIRSQVVTLLRESWLRLVLGMGGYLLLVGVLLDFCLRSLGTPQPILVVFAVVGIERLVTAIPLTPGGAGTAELTLFACLTAAGTAPADALAAALLYRLFTFFAEIPVGAVIALSWRFGSRLTPGGGYLTELQEPEPVA